MWRSCNAIGYPPKKIKDTHVCKKFLDGGVERLRFDALDRFFTTLIFY